MGDTIGMPVETVDDAENLIKGWMKGRRFEELPQQEANRATIELNFNYSSKNRSGLGFAIVQPKDLPRTVVVISRIDVAKEHIDALRSLRAREFERFIWKLNKELLSMPAAFQIQPPNGIPESIQLSQEISFDELNEGRISDALLGITKTAILIVLLFRKCLEFENGEGKEHGD